MVFMWVNQNHFTDDSCDNYVLIARYNINQLVDTVGVFPFPTRKEVHFNFYF